MRILAIRGENLASLAEPFALEFEQEPLRSCGLFAITGETGAGKSTILDALCLALYDTFPRVEATKESERAPDPSGELLKTRDPAPILRRGAGSGYAEVDFVARDGLRYRARCGLQRARGKAGGNLQPRRRSLWRIDAAGIVVEALESGIAPVNRRIVELTDLTFDQFCRTALLAQGDFDAFLRADAGNRADLLEKITGAEIYGRLSQRAYEKARLAQETLAQLQRRHDDIGLLTEDDLISRQTEIETLSQTREETESARAAIQDSLRRLETHARSRDKLALAETDFEAATRALEELAPQAAQLELAERVEPLRNLWRDMRKADEMLRRQTVAAQQAELETGEAEKILALADEKESAARQELQKIEQIIAELTPLWAQASELDVRLAEGTKLAAQAQQDVESARSMADEKRRLLESTQAAQTKKLCEYESAQIEFTRCAPARPLAERLPEIEDWLAKRLELSRENRLAGGERSNAGIERDRIGQSLAAIAAADMKDQEERDALAAQIAEREQTLTALDEESVSMKTARIGAEVAQLQALSRPAADYIRAREARATAATIIAGRTGIVARLTQELEGLLERRAHVARESAEATRLGELAEAAADPQALQLRAALEDGTPCPVCGARDHPFSHNVDAAQQLVDALMARRETARNALDRLDNEIIRAESAAAAVRAETEAAQRQQHAAEVESAEATQAYAALVSTAQETRAPMTIDGAASIIEELLAEHKIEMQALTAQLETARRLRNERDRLAKRFNSTRDTLDHRQIERHGMIERQQNLSQRITQLEATLTHHGERIASLDRSLAPFLKLCDLTVDDLDRDPVSARLRLKQAGQRFQQAQQALDRLTLERQALDLRVAILTSEAQSAVKTVEAQTHTQNARIATLDDLRATRAGLLGAEATSVHRQRHEDKRKSLIAELQSTREGRSLAGERAAAARMLAVENAREVEAATQAFRVAQDAFLQACAVAGLSEQAAIDLLARPQEEMQTLRERLRLAQESCAETRATLAARRQDVESSGMDLPEASQVDLIASERMLAERLETTTARIGALREQIRLDEAARLRAESLSREIVAARATGKLWDDINAAIGSRSGDRFRRFAQSVTLDQLVALANQRLVLLSPRYRLEKSGEIDSLGLQIIDRDLGDERRSTRSLSGGERFLASLALALALAGLEGRDSLVDTLFIDEGFGSLDSMTLDVAIDALESLQGQGRKVGVISHVDSLQQRISTKISVERRGGGLSVVKLRSPGWAA